MQINLKFDESYCTVVVCSCGWRDLHLTRPAAMISAARHVDSCHGDTKRAAVIRYQAKAYSSKVVG